MLQGLSTLVDYFKSHMPLNDPLLKLANVADVECFNERFEILGDWDDPILVNKIHEEFLDYQLLNREDIPNSVWEKAEHDIDPETK